MTFHVSISGAAGHLKQEIHDEIIKLAKEFSDGLKKLGIEHGGVVSTPTNSAQLAHTNEAPPAPTPPPAPGPAPVPVSTTTTVNA